MTTTSETQRCARCNGNIVRDYPSDPPYCLQCGRPVWSDLPVGIDLDRDRKKVRGPVL